MSRAPPRPPGARIAETSIEKWKDQFLEAGRSGLEAKLQRGPTGREAQLEVQVDELTRALGDL